MDTTKHDWVLFCMLAPNSKTVWTLVDCGSTLKIGILEAGVVRWLVKRVSWPAVANTASIVCILHRPKDKVSIRAQTPIRNTGRRALSWRCAPKSRPMHASLFRARAAMDMLTGTIDKYLSFITWFLEIMVCKIFLIYLFGCHLLRANLLSKLEGLKRIYLRWAIGSMNATLISIETISSISDNNIIYDRMENSRIYCIY